MRFAPVVAVVVAAVAIPASAAAIPPPAEVTALQQQFVRVVEAVEPQVVQIETKSGLGSGIVFDTSGDIVTNAHVVGASRRFVVTLADGRRFPGTLVGVFRGDDLAVVHIDAQSLTPATFADSAQLHVGDLVLAIGNPLGLRSSVTQGIVSALGRTESEGGGIVLPNVVQTSAEINPGNSGGALVDIAGNVVGIPTLGAINPENGGAAPGIGFAIPSNTVVAIARQLIQFGRVVNSGRAFLGVRVATIPGGRGAYVGAVLPKSPAARARIVRGDVIVGVGPTPVTGADDLSTALAVLRPRETVAVELVRGTRRLTVQVVLGELPG